MKFIFVLCIPLKNSVIIGYISIGETALVHLKLVTIHPFGDGNDRITRLVMNFVLNRKKYPMYDIPYEERNSYYDALERSQVKKDEKVFLQWLVKRYIKEYKQYLK